MGLRQQSLLAFFLAEDCSRLFHRLALHQLGGENESPAAAAFSWIENLHTFSTLWQMPVVSPKNKV